MHKRFVHINDNLIETVATIIHGYQEDRIDFEIITIAKDSGVQECLRIGADKNGRIYGHDKVVGGPVTFQGIRGEEDSVVDPVRVEKLFAIYDALRYSGYVADHPGKLDDVAAKTVRALVTTTLEECFAKKWNATFSAAQKWQERVAVGGTSPNLGR